MINLEQIREKLENLLNGTDEELGNLVSPNSDKYFFNVATEGFELKRIYDMQSGKNFIPVFIGSAGGEFNAIPNLGQYSLSIQCQVYFPVRFKDDFYIYFTNFIKNVFVGKMLTYGYEKALHNISVPQYGEIESFAVKEFQNFIINTYKMPVEVSEQWMTMTFVIYLSALNEGFAFGNEATASIIYISSEGKIENLPYPVYTTQTSNANVETQSEQILGETQAKSLGVISGYAFSIDLYIQNNGFFKSLLNDYYAGKIQNNHISLLNNLIGVWYVIDCIISTATVNITKGEPITITLNLVKGKD